MSWQKCPLCDGQGSVTMCGTKVKCSCCVGSGIINEQTGRAPEVIDSKEKKGLNSNNSHIGGEFIVGVIEYYPKFGDKGFKSIIDTSVLSGLDENSVLEVVKLIDGLRIQCGDHLATIRMLKIGGDKRV